MSWAFQVEEMETARLRLRPLRENDVDAVFDYASDPEVARYVAFERHTAPGDSSCGPWRRIRCCGASWRPEVSCLGGSRFMPKGKKQEDRFGSGPHHF
jgi:hypothetical protein